MSGRSFPQVMIGGGPIGDAMRAVRDRLAAGFGQWGTAVEIIPPRPSKSDWAQLRQRMPMVAVGWQAWVPSRDGGYGFRGDAQFPIFLMTRQSRREAQYFGDGTLPGLLGMVTLATALLNDWTIGSGSTFLGTARIEHVAAAPDIDWIGEDIAFAALMLMIPNLGFDDEQVTSGLSDFLRLGETVNDGFTTSPPGVINMRGTP